MWCPSVSLSVWANAWLAGAAAPDDVLDALSQWAPRHSVTAYDSVAAGRTGLPWPDLNDAGAVSLLQTLRTAAGSGLSAPAIGVALPVPGDVRGLPAGTQFQRDAVTAGEALIVGRDASDRGGFGSRLRVRRIRGRVRVRTGADRVVVDGVLGADGSANRVRRSRRGGVRIACRGPFGRRRTRRNPRGRRRCRRSPRTRRAGARKCPGAPGARPRTVAGGACARERRPYRRDHHRQLRADPDRVADIIGGADRQRRAAPAFRGGAIGADGRGQRDPALGLAGPSRSSACTPRR